MSIFLLNNRITHLDKASFYGLGHLYKIDLSNNLIKSLPQDIFNNVVQLANIILRGNKLTHIPAKLFVKLPCLTKVDFSQNFLTSVSEHAISPLVYYNKFTHIDLSRNNLTDFPVWLLRLPFLEDINLSFNRIFFKGIEFTLQKLLNISQLYTTVDTTGYLQSKTINFHHNQIVEFDISSMEDNFDLLYQFRLLLTGFRLDFGEVFNCDCTMFRLYQ